MDAGSLYAPLHNRTRASSLHIRSTSCFVRFRYACNTIPTWSGKSGYTASKSDIVDSVVSLPSISSRTKTSAAFAFVNRSFRLARQNSSSIFCPSIESLIDILTSRSEEHTSELQSRGHLVCRLLLEKKK